MSLPMGTQGESQHPAVPVGTRVAASSPFPRAGTWEIVDHADCVGNGRLEAYAPGATAPPCPVCGARVAWQLTHLAASVAADHHGAGHLP